MCFQWLWLCPRDMPTGNNEPMIIATSSSFVKPLCSLTITVPSADTERELLL